MTLFLLKDRTKSRKEMVGNKMDLLPLTQVLLQLAGEDQHACLLLSSHERPKGYEYFLQFHIEYIAGIFLLVQECINLLLFILKF